MPDFPEFKELEPEDKGSIERFLEQHPPAICELSVSNLYIWRKFDRPQLTSINGNLCILINPLDEPSFFLEPLGTNDLEDTLNVCLDHAGVISRASSCFISSLPARDFHVAPLRNHFDYVYSRVELCGLKGRRFDGKRNRIRKFIRDCPRYNFIAFDERLNAEALDLFDAWLESAKGVLCASEGLPCHSCTCQREALEIALAQYDQLNLMGGAITIEGRLGGFIIASRLNAQTACVQFMYGHPEFKIIAQVLLWEACRQLFSSFDYINLEQDLGLDGLRRMKMSYQPLKLEEKFEIRMPGWS
jgi:hypothetical protein